MAIVGAAVLSLQSDFSMGIGDLMTLACAVCFALQIFLTGEFVGKIRPTVLNFLANDYRICTFGSRTDCDR